MINIFCRSIFGGKKSLHIVEEALEQKQLDFHHINGLWEISKNTQAAPQNSNKTTENIV